MSFAAAVLLAWSWALTQTEELPLVVVDRDNVEITESCRVQIGGAPIADTDGNGVIHITGQGAQVTFESGVLRGAPPGADPDTFTGTGIRINGLAITVRGARVRGYRTGIYAARADRLVVEDCDLSNNFAQRLGSTAFAEDPSDWLRPHDNDAEEWRTRYGAALYVSNSRGVDVHGVRAWHTQNGIVLDGVLNGKIYDNDCSFGSGWGIALWRTSRTVISRNAVDFRIRGYSHTVYNRGQDSAGILMFEQCHENHVLYNSATHCGDGIFAFSGREALGEVNLRDNLEWYRGRGHTGNVFADNDCSDAAAHGIELTFAFRNRIVRNQLARNAICGIWGGYSNGTYIADNVIEANGDMPYGDERGGINIEHGSGAYIAHNRFRDNACGIFVWWDEDEHLMALPWAQVNPTAAQSNLLAANSFEGDLIAIQLRDTGPTTVADNTMTNVGVEYDVDVRSERVLKRFEGMDTGRLLDKATPPLGITSPVGARPQLSGRQHIIMTEWGPYDWQSPLLHRIAVQPDRHVFQLLGPEPLRNVSLEAAGLESFLSGKQVMVYGEDTGSVTPYVLTALTPTGAYPVRGALARPNWEIAHFASPVDPREDIEAWRAAAAGAERRYQAHALSLPFGMGGPEGMSSTDHFGTVATTTLRFAPGHYRLITRSDDGIRVWLDDNLVIDDWTWHPPKRHVHEMTLEQPREMEIRVEHFELDGYAEVSLEVEGGPLDESD